MARNPGRFIEVKEGVHKGKKGFMYNKEQEPELQKAKKAAVWLPVEASQIGIFSIEDYPDYKKVLIQYDYIKVIGFID